MNLIEKIDPRIRLIFSLLYSIFLAVEKNFSLFLYYSIIPFFLIFFISDFKRFIKGFWAVNFFIFLLWIFLPFSIPGKEIFHILKFKITQEGVKYTLTITIKANLIFLTNFILIFSSHPLRIVHALHHLHIPKKIVSLLFFSIRYIPVIEGEKNKLERAMKIRSFKPENNLHTYKTIGNLISLIILNSYLRGDRVYKAMILRNFKGIFWTYHHFKWSRTDTFLTFCAIIYFLGLILLKWSH